MGENLPLEAPWVWALGICLIAAVLEGALSGTGIKRRFEELRLPRPSLPLWAWPAIGAAYYFLFFSILRSLLGSRPTPVWTAAGLTLVAILLAANAAWNWIFFRKRNLRMSFLFFLPYVLGALALAFVLFRLGSGLFPWYLLYMGYLVYATWWGYGVWRLNGSSP